jgi:hypothetical protein
MLTGLPDPRVCINVRAIQGGWASMGPADFPGHANALRVAYDHGHDRILQRNSEFVSGGPPDDVQAPPSFWMVGIPNVPH